MPASRRVSQRQLEKLLDFAEANKDIALGRCTRGPQASQTTQRAWETIATKLNSVADGVTKSAEQWRRYWVELKAKTKAKGADIRRNASRTGGGPNKLAPLNDIEERILQIIGRVCVEGLPGVRIPFPIPSGSTSSIPLSQPSTSQATYLEPDLTPQMEVEWLEDENFQLEILSSQLSLPQPSSVPSTSEIIRPSSTPPVPPPPPSPTPPLSPPEPSPTRSYQPWSSPPPHQPQTPPLQRRRPAQSSQSSPLRRSRQRRICNRAVPQWARSLEERRMDIEERHARALEALSVTLDRRLANIENRLIEIRDKLGNK